MRDTPPARRDERDEDDRPRRRDDRDDERPRRRRRDEEPEKSNVTTILLLVGGGLAGILMVCGGLGYAGYTLFSSAFAKVTEAQSRMMETNNLKQLGIAMHAIHDTTRQLPRPAIEKDGKPLLSWRVALLPYVEEEALYRQFRLDEPWDSDHNKRLIPMIPRVYLRPKEAPDGSGRTYYQAVVGKGLLFDFKHVNKAGQPAGRQLMDITDGTSNTIMIVVAKDPVIWTKPEDVDADDGRPILPRLDTRFTAGTVMLMADGAVRTVPKTVSEATLKAALTVNGGDVLGPDW
jgi:hypothetical protein